MKYSATKPSGAVARVLTLVFVFFITALVARADETVRLQLKWHHQFQFAGYYAAVTQGYYAEAGLAVEIIEGNASRQPIARVLAGEADFGVSDNDVLLARLRGEPLVVCAAIFQHSPYVILSRTERNIRTPHDLVGARVMLAEGQGGTQFRAMLKREAVDIASINIVSHSWSLDDLISGRVDAISAYATVEPHQLKRRGVTTSLLRTVDYGVDFYGDTLFTTEAGIADHPARASAFVRASLRGWEYAMRHPEELVDHILTLPGVVERGVVREDLLGEAEAMRAYVLPDVVEIGQMNPGRWRAIADIFAEQGLAPANASLEGFMPDTERVGLRRLFRQVVALAAVLGVGVGLVLTWNMQMRARVQLRTRELRAEVARREAAESELRRGRERLKLAQDVGEIGDWTYEESTGRITWSDTLFRLHLRDPARGAPNLEEWMALYHPEDAALLREKWRHAKEGRGECSVDVRLRLPDGRQTYHHLVGRLDADADPRKVRLHGIEQDVTARKLAESRLRAQLHELERWRESTLGREERIHDLKQEINALLARTGQPPRYGIEPPARLTANGSRPNKSA